MTVHWNSRRGFADGSNTSSTGDTPGVDEEARVNMSELLWAMRKTPEVRTTYVNRGKRLLADPGYPPPEVLKAVANLLAGNFNLHDLE
jgi:hypothetical protein